MSSAFGPGIGRNQARELARHELARSIYRPSLLSRWWQDIVHWLSSVVSPAHAGEPNWLAVAVLAVVVAVAALAAFYWLGSPRANRRNRAEPVVGGRSRTAAEYRRAAEQLAASGNYQEAIAELVRAIAVDLEAREILLPKPARTADELAAEAALAFPAESGELTAATRLFDEVRYGGRPGSQAGYERVQGLDSRLASATPAAQAGLAMAGASG
jgi:type II secretory pathway pseudopilin PulG